MPEEEGNCSTMVYGSKRSVDKRLPEPRTVHVTSPSSKQHNKPLSCTRFPVTGTRSNEQ